MTRPPVVQEIMPKPAIHSSDIGRRTTTLKVRLTPETRKKLEALAAAAGIPISAWITAQVDAYRKPRMDRADVRTALTEARRVAAGQR